MTRQNKFVFYSRNQYYDQLIKRIDQTEQGSRVVIATMSFKPAESPIERIMSALTKASKRGVEVRLMVDSFAFMMTNKVLPGPLLFTRTMPAKFPKILSKRLAILEELATAGGTYIITNPPRRAAKLPYAGRSHIKFAVIDDEVFIGGCNLTEANHTDLMAQWNDPKIADWLSDYAAKLQKAVTVRNVLNGKDIHLTIDTDTKLLLDAGVQNQSLIFENALRLIDQAKDFIFLSCQYSPNGIMASHLTKAANRGVRVKLIYNHPSTHPFPFNMLHFAVKQRAKRNNSRVLFDHELTKKHDYLHAKLLATEKSCMIGSHNYVQEGVQYGTAEVALLSTDPSFGKDAVAALEQQL